MKVSEPHLSADTVAEDLGRDSSVYQAVPAPVIVDEIMGSNESKNPEAVTDRNDRLQTARKCEHAVRKTLDHRC